MRKSAASASTEKSRFSLSDFFSEILSSLSSRPARTLMTLAGTVLGIASFIGIIGLTQTAAGQISEKFNALEATTVHVTDNYPKIAGAPALGFPLEASKRMKKLNGTTSATLFWKTDTNNRPLNLSLTPASTGTTPSNFPIYAADDGLFDFAARGFSSGIAYNAFHVDKKSRVLVLGAKTAEGLGIENLTLARTIYINNEPYTVLGILKSVSEIPELDTAAIIPSTTALELYGPPSTESPAQMMIRTKLGAAQLIARQAPYALRPDAPQYFAVDAPPDWSKATRGVKRSLSGLLLGLAALALFIGCVGIANSTLTSIFERIPEIGLRRALGARAVHVSAQVLGETAVLGLIGGLVGMSLGVVAVLGVCGVQSWTPVLDPLLLVFGPLLGILTGVLAGIYPAVKASRISPISALQHL